MINHSNQSKTCSHESLFGGRPIISAWKMGWVQGRAHITAPPPPPCRFGHQCWGPVATFANGVSGNEHHGYWSPLEARYQPSPTVWAGSCCPFLAMRFQALVAWSERRRGLVQVHPPGLGCISAAKAEREGLLSESPAKTSLAGPATEHAMCQFSLDHSLSIASLSHSY